jgi:reverse transcriptase-like protein
MDYKDPPSYGKRTSRAHSDKEVPQEPCVMLKGGVVVFFYVGDIVFCYRKGDKEKAHEVIQQLKMEYQLSTLGELKWFLGIHVLRDRSQRLLWLTQEAYIEKIVKQYEIDLNGRLPTLARSHEGLCQKV